MITEQNITGFISADTLLSGNICSIITAIKANIKNEINKPLIYLKLKQTSKNETIIIITQEAHIPHKI